MPKLSAYLSSSSQTDVELDRLKGALKDSSGTQLRLRTDTTGKQQVRMRVILHVELQIWI